VNINASAPQSPGRQGALGRLAGWCYDHRRVVLAGWLAAVVLVIVLAALA
jgi:hypothetical protein